MTTTNDDIEELLSALHGDKKSVLRAQLRTIEGEIQERERISKNNEQRVQEEAGTLRNAIINLEPPHANAPDVERKDRMVLERERLELTKELRLEERDAWKDVQQLRREEREVEKELTTEEQRHKRNKDAL
jgi:hypothetical protein